MIADEREQCDEGKGARVEDVGWYGAVDGREAQLGDWRGEGGEEEP